MPDIFHAFKCINLLCNHCSCQFVCFSNVKLKTQKKKVFADSNTRVTHASQLYSCLLIRNKISKISHSNLSILICVCVLLTFFTTLCNIY